MKSFVIPLTIVSILADGKFHSNKQLKDHLGINYVDIHKHIQTLRDWGVSLFTIPTEGYILSQPIQLLDKKFICSQIETGNIEVLPVINSTNQYLLERLAKLSSGDTCITEYQYAGRGRRDHKWFSPFGINIYFSTYWQLKFNSKSLIGLSLMVAIVIAEVLQELSSSQIQIKWPNDLYLKNRKLAGVLVELINRAKNISQLIIGVGINIAMRSVQEETINQNWISLYEVNKNINRNALLVQLIKKLHASLICFEQEGLSPFLQNWKILDNFINYPVRLIINNKIKRGVVRGINACGELLLEQDSIIKQWIDSEILL